MICRALAATLSLLVVSVCSAAERTPRAASASSYTMLRSGAVVRSNGVPLAFTSEQQCLDERDRPETGVIAMDVKTRTSGEARYVCRKDTGVTVRFIPNPITPPPVAVNCVVSAWGTWNDPAWSTCTSGSQSRTLTRSRTVTTQPANGGTACPSLTESTTETRACSTTVPGSVSLYWTPPVANDDGSSLSNLAGFSIHYGTTGGTPYTVRVSNPSVTRHTLTGLRADDYHFCVRAFTTDGRESACSNVVYHAVR